MRLWIVTLFCVSVCFATTQTFAQRMAYDHPQIQACYNTKDRAQNTISCLLDIQRHWEQKVFNVLRDKQSYAEKIDNSTNNKFDIQSTLNNTFDQFQKYMDAECTDYIRATYTHSAEWRHEDATCRIVLMSQWIENHQKLNHNASAPQKQGEE